MKQIPLWQSPKTSRAYLHPSGARRLVSIYPDMKITDLDLGDQGRHYNQPGFGVHLIFGSEPGDCDMEKTEWDKPSGGIRGLFSWAYHRSKKTSGRKNWRKQVFMPALGSQSM